MASCWALEIKKGWKGGRDGERDRDFAVAYGDNRADQYSFTAAAAAAEMKPARRSIGNGKWMFRL